MEYALIGCGVFYFLKKKKYISLQKFKNIKFVNYTIKHFKSITDKDNLSNDLIKKMSSYEYQVDKYKSNYIYNKTYKVVQFKSATDINGLNIYTDADEYGGDSVADVSYNIKDDALIITGHLEMKSKHLIEYDKMFVKVVFNNLQINYYEKINLVRICVKTNGHVVKLLLAEEIAKINIEYYKAYVLDKSSEFRTYEIPLLNFKLANEFISGGNHVLERINLWKLMLEIESKIEGPFEVELKSIDFIYDNKVDKIYEKYDQAIFQKI